jgi:hypothetical protein
MAQQAFGRQVYDFLQYPRVGLDAVEQLIGSFSKSLNEVTSALKEIRHLRKIP